MEVSVNSLPHAGELEVVHSLRRAMASDDGPEARVVTVRDAGEKVVLHLEIQPADKPCEHAALGSVVRGRGELVQRPVR